MTDKEEINNDLKLVAHPPKLKVSDPFLPSQRVKDWSGSETLDLERCWDPCNSEALPLIELTWLISMVHHSHQLLHSSLPPLHS